MKTQTIKIATLAFLLMSIVSLTYGQVSQGGSPYSFDTKIKTKQGKPITPKENLRKTFMPKITQTQIDSIRLINRNSKHEKAFQIAYSFDINIDIKTSAIIDTLDIGILYRYEIESEGAYSLNIIFSEYEIPRGAKVFIYNLDTEHIIGAFTRDNNKASKVLATVPVKGDKITIEYFEPLFPEFEGKLKVGKVSHDFTGFYKQEKNFGSSGDCNIDINCPLGNTWQNEKRSVCKIIIDGKRVCSGTLVNNTNEDGTPYFLTANHCISTQNKAENSVFIFNYESPTCDGSDGLQNQSISGADLRATRSASDFTLLELSKMPLSTYNPFFAGWDNQNLVKNDVVGIHHPEGDVKKICIDNDNIQSTAYSDNTVNINANYWRIVSWDEGVTEGGSSGSPLFDNNRRIIGQLHGGFAACDGEVNNGLSDWYGKFSTAWEGDGSNNSRLRNWLDPDNTGIETLSSFSFDCLQNKDDIVVNRNITWNKNRKVSGNIIIKEHQVLHINQGVIVNFCNSDYKIIIERGGTLILDGATLTSSSSDRWSGIEVWGTDHGTMPSIFSLNQAVGLQGGNGSFTNTSDQGVLIMRNGAKIENAHEAFRNYKTRPDGWSDPAFRGGVIWAKDSKFYNCRRSSEFLKWETPSGIYHSKYDNCEFIIDSNFDDVPLSCTNSRTEPTINMVTLWDVHGIEFVGNTFRNDYPNLYEYNRGVGIRSINAGFRVIDGNQFHNFTHGIHILSENGGLTVSGFPIKNQVSIRNNTFDNNITGIYALGSNFGSATKNTFNIPNITRTETVPTTYSPTIGIALEATERFTIKENYFKGLGSHGKSYGLASLLSFGYGDKIDKNKFNDLAIGTQIESNLSNIIISCNEYENIGKAWVINPSALPTQIDQFTTYLCAQGATFNDQGTDCTPNSIQVDNTFKDAGKKHIFTFTEFSYAYNKIPGEIPVNADRCVTLIECDNGKEKCSNTGTPSKPSDSQLLQRNPTALANMVKSKPDVNSKRKLMGEIIKIHLENNRPQPVIAMLELIKDNDSKKILVPSYIQDKEYVKARTTLNSIDVIDDETQDFMDIYTVQLDLLQNGNEISAYINDAMKKQVVDEISETETRYSYVAKLMKHLAQVCNSNPSPYPKEFAVINDGNPTNPALYKLKAIPNPANNNFVAEYDLADKTNGKIIIKDAITGLEMKSVVLDASQKSVPIQVNGLPKGNYILELQGDNTYLKSEHLMVY